ncbi:MAG: hypothetical protein ACI4Q3_05350 [Kiritimatiellia bacterium]
MERLVVGAIFALAASVGGAEYVSPVTGKPIAADGKLTIEQIKERDERVMKKTGGFVEVAANGVAVAVWDGRTKPGGAAIQFADVFGSLSRTNVKVERKPLAAGAQAVDAAIAFRGERKAAYAVAIVEDAALRGLTVLPEDGVALVNAARYVDGADDPVKAEVRIHKEVWRALGFVAGIGYAPYPNDVMQNVSTVRELDALEYQVMQPMNFQKMYGALAKAGITRARRVPYRVACREGWAAPPTNDYQKAVWNEVHAIPDKPLTIEFDPKKDK